jgi:DNA-binding transcriptional ArsR family regulator
MPKVALSVAKAATNSRGEGALWVKNDFVFTEGLRFSKPQYLLIGSGQVLAAIRDHPIGLCLGPKMAGALTDPWRLRILMELSGRPMSPSQFVEKVGGELTEIARHFRQLADWGYLRVIEERIGPRRGASIERIYEVVQRAHFDTSTWEGLPRFQRDVVSDSILGSYFNRVAEAINAETFDQEVDRHLSWDGVILDRLAWVELGAELDRVLDWLPLLEAEAAPRLEDGEEPIPTTVSLAAFRSPQSVDVMWRAPRRRPSSADESTRKASGTLITVEMAKVMRNRWRSRILMELYARPLSPSQFVEEVGGSISYISRCFRELADWGFIEVVEEVPGGRHGGGVERIYRNCQQAYFDTETWSQLPPLFRSEFSNSILGSYLARVNEAIKAGTFDAEKDRHLSWIPLMLDRRSWGEVSQCLDRILDWLPELQSDSIKRHRGPIEKLIPTTVGLSSFRSPRHAGDQRQSSNSG